MNRKVIFLILISKILIFACIILGFYFLPFHKINYGSNFHYPPNEPITLQTAFKTWDAQHYLYLSRIWYRQNQESNRFFPILSLSIKLIDPFIQNPLISGLVVSNLFSAVGIVFFYLFVRDFFKNSNLALWSVVLLLVFPSSFYLSLVYSESVFFCFTMLVFYFLYKNQFKWVTLFSFFIPLSRPVGILIIVPIAFYLLTNGRSVKQLADAKKFLPLLGPILGFIVYSFMMNFYTSSLFSGYAAQESYGSGWHILIDPALFLRNLFSPIYSLHTYLNSIVDRVFFVFFISSLYYIYRKLDKTLFVYSLAFGLIPLFGSFTSYTRYVLVVFPIYMVMGIFFQGKDHRFSKFLLMAGLIIMQVIFLIEHALNYWVA